MLTKLELQNFQVHRNLEIQLQPGLNVITGPSDTGKSAIIRALRWLALHESISGLMTNGETSLKVALSTEDGDAIMRFKNTKEYGYALNGKTKYLACARDQPIGIQSALDLTPTNFQSQFDPHFLLSLTPGQVAKEINKIVALEDIDKALGWLKEQIKANGILRKAEDTKVVELGEALKAMEHVPRMGDMLDALEKLSEVIDTLGLSIKAQKQLTADYATVEANYYRLVARDWAGYAAATKLSFAGSIKDTKQALESIVRDYRTIDALPQLEALGGVLGGRITQKQEIVAWKADATNLEAWGDCISDKKAEIKSRLASGDAILVTAAMKIIKLTSLVTDLEDVDHENLIHETEARDIEHLLSQRATCEKCGRKY